MISFDYSHEYDPPAAVMEIVLIAANGARRVGPLVAFVDSGADGTIVPLDFLEQIQAEATDEIWIRSHWGESRRVSLYLVAVQIDTIMLHATQVVGDPQSEEVILGRDVLNQLRVLLDGLGEVVEVSL